MTEKKTRRHLDILYSPSAWSTRLCACRVLANHTAFIVSESDKATVQIPNQLDVVYGPTEMEKLDIFGIDLPSDAPICFFVHGGFWQEMSKKDYRFPAVLLHQLGIKMFAVDYALCPDVTLKEITEQIRNAFKFTLKYANDHNSRSIHLIGHSAGAHLIAHLLGDRTPTEADAFELVENVVLISGVYDLQELVGCYVNDKLKLNLIDAHRLSPLSWFAPSEGEAKEGKEKSAAAKRLCAYKRMKMFVVIAEDDSPVFHAQSEQFYRNLQNICVHSEYVYVPGRDHFDILEFLFCDKNDNANHSFIKNF